MKHFLGQWIEQYLFYPNLIQKLLSILLLPFTLLYCIISALKKIQATPHDFGIAVISVGNLLVGGTGKTPVTIALAKKRSKVAIVLRGYGRDSQGLYVIAHQGSVLENVATSGDEAMLLAQSLPNATIIVAENRAQGILKAKELGCKLVFLDDGYGKHSILKYDLLLRPHQDPSNVFCLPSGGYRHSKMMYAFADCVLKEKEDFQRVVSFIDLATQKKAVLPQKIVLLTAISKPERLLEFLPAHTIMARFLDHYTFTQKDIDTLHTQYPHHIFVTTSKDMVKLETLHISFKLYLMDLEVVINPAIEAKIENYLSSYKQKASSVEG